MDRNAKALHVLIVDDDSDLRDTLADTFELRGHHVTSASSGEECVRLALSQEFDLILLDVKLPGISGVQALSQIRRQKSDARVIIMTGYARDEDVGQAVQENALAILNKPLDLGSILKIAECQNARKVVLIADDDLDFASYVEELLEREGYSVAVVHSGKEAVEFVRSQNVQPDLLLLDLRLPDVNGLDLYQRILECGVCVPTFIVTGFPEESNICPPGGDHAHPLPTLTKPIAPNTLLESIRGALR
jgi:CheY-like chemotaxis protein